MNSLILAGPISSDPASRDLSSGKKAVTFRLTVPYREGVENTFSITAFGNLAGNLIGTIQRGDRLLVKGHMENGGIVADDVGLSFRDGNPFEDDKPEE